MKPMKPMVLKQPSIWWPQELGHPSSAGGQNDVQYAYFSGARRLLLRHGDQITMYDTGDHDIQGVSQASDADHTTFTTNRGVLDTSQLKRL